MNSLITDGMAVQHRVYIEVAEEAQRLIGEAILTRRMNYHIACPSSATFISFHNVIGNRKILAKISYSAHRQVHEVFEMTITEEEDGRGTELISVSRHKDLERLVRTGKGFLCFYQAGNCAVEEGEKPVTRKGAGKVAVSIRVDAELRQAFDEAAKATGESQAVVLRQLIRYFVGKGPDPSIRYRGL